MQSRTSMQQQLQIRTPDPRAVEAPAAVELSDGDLDVAAGGLVVNAIIAVLFQPVLPSQYRDMSPDQARQVAAGNPMPRPR